MTVTFMVTAHTDPEMFGRLVQSLEPHRIIAHIDAKSDISAFRQCVSPSVEFTRTRHVVSWAGFSQVNAMRALIAHAGVGEPDEYFVMLSGQDYPVRSIREFVDLLEATPGMQYIRAFEINEQASAKYSWQLERRHYRDLLPRLAPKFRRVVLKAAELATGWFPNTGPDGLRVFHGQTHWALTRACVEDALGRLTPELERYFSRTFASDEKVFHSLVATGPYASQVHGGAPGEFVGEGNFRYTNFHYIRPDLGTLRGEDVQPALDSGKFFARKVTSITSADFLDEIDGVRRD